MSRVYVTRNLPASVLDRLGGLEVSIWQGDGPVPYETLVHEVNGCDGLLCMLTDRIDVMVLDAGKDLRVVSQMAVGVDNIDVSVCDERGIAVGHTPGVLTNTVADHVFALLGSIVRRLPEGSAEVASGSWGEWDPFHLAGGDLWGTTIGIVGMGRIGRAVATRAEGFGMEVLYASPRSRSEIGRRISLEDLLAKADHVVISAALNDATRGLIGSDQLALMKETAYLVNVSRGPLLVTNDLVDALVGGSIAGAALDVTDPEPLPADHPLVGLPNCLVVPHIGSASVQTRMAMANMAVDNLIAGVEDRDLIAQFRSWS